MLRGQVCYNVIILLFILAMVERVVATVQIEAKFQMSSKRAFFSNIEVDKKIYFVGGYEHSDYIASNAIEVFDLVTGNWSDRSISLATPRGVVSTVVIGPIIYMIGGHIFDTVPLAYSAVQKSFFSSGFTSGPTVRRPVRLSLHNATLTVIGFFSVDFMDTNNKTWTHNEKLTAVMAQLYEMTTIAQHNFVFVIGGINTTTQLPSTNIWTIDTATATPRFDDILPTPDLGSFIGSWFDEDNGAIVIKFDNISLIYHTPTQKWFQRAVTGKLVSSLAYQHSTMVFYTDGYWTIDWPFMNETWTPRTQINFAFTIGNQLVYCAASEMSIISPNTTETRTVNVGPAPLSIALNSTIQIIASESRGLFAYNAVKKQLDLITDLSYNFTPIRIFKDNTTVYVIGNSTAGKLYMVLIRSLIDFPVTEIDFLPDVLLDKNFYYFSKGFIRSADLKTLTFMDSIAMAVWAQQDNQFFLMKSSGLFDVPVDATPYRAIDVYNYVNNTWEPSIPFPEQFIPAYAYINAFVFNDLINLKARTTILHLNETEEWTTVTSMQSSPLTHPTYSPTPVLDNIAYLGDSGSAGLLIIQPNLDGQRVSADLKGIPQQIIGSNEIIVMSFAQQTNYTFLALFNTTINKFAGFPFEDVYRMVSIAIYDDWYLVFTDNTTFFSYTNSLLHWAHEPFDNSFVPASMFSTQSFASNQTTLVIAGGYHRIGGYYTDQLMFWLLDLAQPSGTQQPESGPIFVPVSVPSAPTDDSNTIVIAVVVPIGAVAIAGALLVVILIRRKKQRKRSAKTIAIGLESQFGKWFVPFSDLQFGVQLGQGANGQVFKGKWKNTDVALKTSMTQANQTIASELSLMINMRPHPNVVQLFGFSVHPETNSIILILEYCNGGSLDTVLYDNTAPINPSTKLYWLKSICKGISHLHSNNLVHRDIAARNVLLNQEEPKLTDFGMTRLVDEEQQRGTTKSELGPIRWMAPESLKSKEYSNKSDVWSFGILMYEVLVQLEPHVNEDPIEVGRRIRDEGLTPELPSNIECYSDFSSLLNQCCVVDPSHRPTIEKVLEKLEQIPL